MEKRDLPETRACPHFCPENFGKDLSAIALEKVSPNIHSGTLHHHLEKNMKMEMELASQMEWRNVVLSRSTDCSYIHLSRPLSRDHNPMTNEKEEEERKRIDYSFDGLQSRCRRADRRLRRTDCTKKVHFRFLALRLKHYLAWLNGFTKVMIILVRRIGDGFRQTRDMENIQVFKLTLLLVIICLRIIQGDEHENTHV